MINKIKKIAELIKNFIFKHKIISAIIILCLLGGGFWGYKSLTNTTGETRYILAAATKGTIISSVSGTGQVSASNQINLSPGSGASGKIVYLNAVSGQKVLAGTLLMQLDTTEAQKAVRDAESSLESARIASQKLEGDSTLTIPKNKQDTINNKQDAIDVLNQDYQSAYNTISSIFTESSTIMTDLQTIVTFYIYENILTSSQKSIDFSTDFNLYKNSLAKSYNTAYDEYNKNFNNYKLITINSDNTTIDSMISETYNTTKDIAQATKDANNLIEFYKDTLINNNIESTITDTQLSTVNSDASKVNSYIISLLNTQNTLKNDKYAITNAEYAITNADLDVTSQQLSFTKAQNALTDAKNNLSNYYIYAPFNGVIGAVSIKKGDTISSGTSAITFITQNQMTQISLSEVDITKIKLGQKTILTFDAINGLSITGKVTEIDTIGTVSQGVVNYNVKITFDTQDDRIKPGMSVSANVITETKQDVLTVPNSAVKSKNGNYYVLVLSQKQDLNSSSANQGFISATTPTQKTVQIGLADDTNTEITNGLSEGDQVVARTISGTQTTSATSNSSTRTTNRATQTLIGGPGGRPGD